MKLSHIKTIAEQLRPDTVISLELNCIGQDAMFTVTSQDIFDEEKIEILVKERFDLNLADDVNYSRVCAILQNEL